jgi:hypothetical protein
MGSPNGGIIGVINPTSFGKDTVTSKTSSGDLTTQPGTRLVESIVVSRRWCWWRRRWWGKGGGGWTAPAPQARSWFRRFRWRWRSGGMQVQVFVEEQEILLQ